MNKILRLILLSATVSLTLGWANLSLAKSVEEEIKETGVLKVGVREDSPLFGYGDTQDGYCKDFANALATVMSEKLGTTVETELVTSTTQNRWELVNSGMVHLECGPNTLTQERESEFQIEFSQPFFVTATQIFVKADVTEEEIKTGNIGTIAGTTNAEEIQQVYPNSQINSTYTNRVEGIEAVQSGELTGFASDGILIVGTATVLQLDQNSFALATPVVNGRQFCAAYAMILPPGEENASWRETVNSLISREGQGAQLWDMWFKPLSPYIDKTLVDCQVVQ